MVDFTNHFNGILQFDVHIQIGIKQYWTVMAQKEP